MVVIYTRAYNAENTIRDTIECVLNQTYTDFRYVLFNNGSIDNTLDIMREYARKDKRIVILSSSVNKIGFLSCLPAFNYIINNYGEDDYFCNIDADDVYELTFFEEMVNFCENNTLDVAFCGYNILERDTGKLLDCKTLSDDLVMNNSELPNYFTTYRRYTTDMWAKFFKVSLLEFYLQPDRFEYLKMRNNQQSFIFDAMSNAAKVGFLAKPMLNYYESNIVQKNIRMNGTVDLIRPRNVFMIMNEFLESFPNISAEVARRNYEYMYAIYCGYIKDLVAIIMHTNAMSLAQKITYFFNIYKDKRMQDALMMKASEEFLSLRMDDKKQLCQNVIEFIKNQEGWEKYVTNVEAILEIMQKCGIEIV